MRSYRRGPDDDGLWQDNVCTEVFRRLAILDLSPSGHQPMLSEDRRYVLVFNGEIYNFKGKGLRCELERCGYHFRSAGDSEVALYSLVQWGKDALARFNGMFALAFYDTQSHSLLIARDHAGIKPLYFLQTAQQVVFASQYDQILQHPAGRKASIDTDAAGLY